MQITPTHLTDIYLIEPKVFGDDRGFFMETYQARRFVEAGIPTSFVQDNHSRSRQGTLRGLHYQIQQAQGKLVRVIIGEVFDVAVDIRRSSTTFGRWVGMILSEHNKLQLWVPPGFAHGIYVTSEWADVLYKTTDYYAPEWERTIRWDDSDLGIEWPLVGDQPPLLSAKDSQGKTLREAEIYD
jgi:dTDP-4-dehydrorhamnose 3,5-epimerase